MKFDKWIAPLSLLILSDLSFGPCEATEPAEPLARVVLEKNLKKRAPTLIAEGPIAGMGIAVIRGGALVYHGAFGEQGPGVPMSADTVFNTASVAKTVTAETLLALAEAGRIDLNEPIADHVQHPELSHDERYEQLTPKLLLSHRAGLLNWPYSYEDGVLAFDHAPGERFSYSGAGIELAAQYAVAKTKTPWPRLVSETVLDPLEIEELALGRLEPWVDGKMAVPMNAEGVYESIEALNPTLAAGDANAAADDLVVTVQAYVKLLEGLLAGELAGRMVRRTTLLTSFEGDPIYGCADLNLAGCPDEYGHSLGWQVFRWGDHIVVTHSGSDRGENALVYFSPDTQNGAVIFVNGAAGWPAMARVIEILGDEPQLANYYSALIETRLGIPMPPLPRSD